MKFIKIGLYAVAALILLVVAAAIFFVATFDANEYKPQITQQVKQHTGRDFALGDIKPSVFPWLGIELQTMSLSNAAGFAESPMLEIEQVDVRVELLPLLKQEIRVDTLRIHGLDVVLQKNVQGKTNWDDILEKQQATSDTSTAADTGIEKSEVETAQDTALPLFKVNGLEITDAKALWDDAQLKQKITLHELNLITGAIQLGKPVPLEISARLETTKPSAKVQLDSDVEITFNMESQELDLNQLSMDVKANLAELDVDELKLHLESDVQAKLEQQTFSIPSLHINVDAKGKAIPGGAIDAKVSTDAHLNLITQVLNVNKFSLITLGVALNGQLDVEKLMDAPFVKGRIDVDEFNPSALLSQIDVSLPEMKNKQAVKSIALGFDLEATTESLLLDQLKLKLDESSLTGSLSVNDFEQPEIKYNLALDKINVDDYLPPPVKEDVSTTSQTAAPAAAGNTTTSEDIAVELPVEMLRTLNLAGVFTAQTIQGFDQTISQLLIETKAEKGLIKVPKINAQLLEGSVFSSASLDVRPVVPLYNFHLNAKGIKADSFVNPVLQELLGETAVSITGASHLTATVNTSGKTVKQLMVNSHGNVSFNADKAILSGVDAEYFVRKALAAYLEEKKVPVKDEWRGEYKPKETTAIKTLRATATIRKGVVQNKDLLLDAPRFNVTGAGTINLPKETLNYRTVVDVQPQRTKTTMEKMLDVPLAVIVKGSFSQPQIVMDKKAWSKQVGKALTGEAAAKAKRKVEQAKKEAKLKAEQAKKEAQLKLEKAKQAKKAELERKKKEEEEKLKEKLKDKFKGLFN